MIYIAIQTNKTIAEVNDILINHAGFCDFSTEEYSEEKEMIYAVSFSEPHDALFDGPDPEILMDRLDELLRKIDRRINSKGRTANGEYKCEPRPAKEGTVRKGGVNQRPTTPKPKMDPPPQGTKKTRN